MTNGTAVVGQDPALAECDGCGEPAALEVGYCRACWLGQEAADDLQRAINEAIRFIARADELLDEVKDKDRLSLVHGQACTALAAASNLRLEVMKKCRRRS